jgi:glycosyltransferase-like protein
MSSGDGTPAAPLRIALLTYSVKPRGGVVHTLALGEQLQALGHEVHAFALGKGQQGFYRPTSLPFSLIPFGELADDAPLDARIQRYIEAYDAFLGNLPPERFDVYHAQDCISANGVWRARAQRPTPIFVRTVHHIDDFSSPALIKCQNDSLYRPNHRIVVSRVWQQRLRDEFGLGSEVIYNGVDLGRFRPPTPAERAEARASLGLRDAFVFLNIGGVEPRKNTLRLLAAFEQARQRLEGQGRAALLLLAGGETLLDHRAYRAEFCAQLERSTLRDGHDLRQFGVVADAQIRQLYYAADALAFPSIKEGWGLVVLEALACGLPVLASDLPVFREYLTPDQHALLIDPLDERAIAAGMLRLAQDAVLRQRLAAAGPGLAARFSWAAAARQHADWYRLWLAAQAVRA